GDQTMSHHAFPIQPDPAFPEAEHRERLARAREALAEAKLDAVVCVAPEHLYYLAGFDGHTHFQLQALVFGATKDPTLIFRDTDIVNAREFSWVSDMRVYHHGVQDPISLIVDAAREHAVPGGRIGVCFDSFALPGAAALRLNAALGGDVADATNLIERLRFRKSARELDYMRKAGAIAEAGRSALRQAVADGATEMELAGAIEHAMRLAGTEYPAMPTWFSTGPRTSGGHRTPTMRKLRRGEPVKAEFAGVQRRYHSVTIQTLWLGQPSQAATETYDAVLHAFRAACEKIKVGNPTAAAEDAAFSEYQRRGLDVGVHARLGCGISAAYPPSWIEGYDITRESGERFQADTTFLIHTHMRSADGYVVLVGGTYALTESGLECLAGGDLEMTVI
uniref:M24 family metallopeptidase n=1 Tax=Ensifer aridi TaxID=1708715 RepID=UPI0009BF78D7